MFLTLKNGLEAGSFIFQIFLCGEGGSGRQIKSIHNCFFPSGFESMQHSIDWWLLCHGNNEAKNYLTYTGHQFSRDVSGGLFGICGKWRPVASETAVATVRLTCVLPLLSIWQAWPQQSWCLWFSADVRMFLSWLECVPWNWAWWTLVSWVLSTLLLSCCSYAFFWHLVPGCHRCHQRCQLPPNLW